MQFILAAVFVFVGAGPVSELALRSPLAPQIVAFQQSTAIQSVLGNPDWLMMTAFLMLCYGAAGAVMRMVDSASRPSKYFVSDGAAFQAGVKVRPTPQDKSGVVKR